MNLQPASIEDIPVGKPLPWDVYDNSGYIVLAKGEIVSSREKIEHLEGLQRAAIEAKQIETFPPRGIKPQIGERIQFRLLNRSLQNYHSARLIGYIRNHSILVTVPLFNGNALILTDGEQLEVRMVTGNNICVFRTAIQRVCISPVHYLHLDYPVAVHVQKLRKSPWAKMNLSATASDAKGAQEIALNLSPNGAQLHAPPTLGRGGDTIRVSFHAEMDELKTALSLDATIVHVHEVKGEANMTAYGVSFKDMSAENAIWLKGLVYRHIAEGGLA